MKPMKIVLLTVAAVLAGACSLQESPEFFVNRSNFYRNKSECIPGPLFRGTFGKLPCRGQPQRSLRQRPLPGTQTIPLSPLRDGLPPEPLPRHLQPAAGGLNLRYALWICHALWLCLSLRIGC